MSWTDSTYAFLLTVDQSPQIACLHPALSCDATFIFLHYATIHLSAPVPEAHHPHFFMQIPFPGILYKK